MDWLVIVLGQVVPACAPEQLSNLHFYNALSSPKWLVNATNYGMLDLLDPLVANINSVRCIPALFLSSLF